MEHERAWHSDGMEDPRQVLTGAEVVAKVRRLVDASFSDALTVIVGGSLIRGEGTPTSDADLLIVCTRADVPFRESLRFQGLPVEAFVHTVASYRAYAAADCQGGNPTLPAICAEGVVVSDPGGLAAKLQSAARDLLREGPPPLTAAELDDHRYRLTDWLADLEGLSSSAPVGVRDFVVDALVPAFATFWLRRRERWTGTGKWLYRHLDTVDGVFAGRLAEAARMARCQGRAAALTTMVDEELAQCGGRLFAGYRRQGVAPEPQRDPTGGVNSDSR